MSFNPLPMGYEDRKYQQLAHAQRMLDIIGSLGVFSTNPLPKYNYGANVSKINQQINSDFLDSILNSSMDRVTPKKGALQRRYSRK